MDEPLTSRRPLKLQKFSFLTAADSSKFSTDKIVAAAVVVVVVAVAVVVVVVVIIVVDVVVAVDVVAIVVAGVVAHVVFFRAVMSSSPPRLNKSTPVSFYSLSSLPVSWQFFFSIGKLPEMSSSASKVA